MLTAEIIIGALLIAYAVRLDRRRERLARDQAERGRRLARALLPHLKEAAARGAQS